MNNASPLPGFSQWRVGSKVVTGMPNGCCQATPTPLPGNPAEPPAGLPTDLPLPVVGHNAFLVQDNGHPPVLIDAGLSHQDNLGLVHSLLQRLPTLGLAAIDIGWVLLPRLHDRHFGGLIAADGCRHFPQARVWVSAEAYTYWLATPQPPGAGQRVFRNARLTLQPYEVIISELPGPEIVPGLTAVDLPDHTGFLLQSGGEQLLIWGDAVSVPGR